MATEKSPNFVNERSKETTDDVPDLVEENPVSNSEIIDEAVNLGINNITESQTFTFPLSPQIPRTFVFELGYKF